MKWNLERDTPVEIARTSTEFQMGSLYPCLYLRVLYQRRTEGQQGVFHCDGSSGSFTFSLAGDPRRPGYAPKGARDADTLPDAGRCHHQGGLDRAEGGGRHQLAWLWADMSFSPGPRGATDAPTFRPSLEWRPSVLQFSGHRNDGTCGPGCPASRTQVLALLRVCEGQSLRVNLTLPNTTRDLRRVCGPGWASKRKKVGEFPWRRLEKIQFSQYEERGWDRLHSRMGAESSEGGESGVERGQGGGPGVGLRETFVAWMEGLEQGVKVWESCFYKKVLDVMRRINSGRRGGLVRSHGNSEGRWV